MIPTQCWRVESRTFEKREYVVYNIGNYQRHATTRFNWHSLVASSRSWNDREHASSPWRKESKHEMTRRSHRYRCCCPGLSFYHKSWEYNSNHNITQYITTIHASDTTTKCHFQLQFSGTCNWCLETELVMTFTDNI